MRLILATSFVALAASPSDAETSVMSRPANCQLLGVIQFEDCRLQRSFVCGDSHATVYRTEWADVGAVERVEHRSPYLVLAGLALADGGIEILSRDLPQMDGGPDPISLREGHNNYSVRVSLSGRQSEVMLTVDHAVKQDDEVIDGIPFQDITQDWTLQFQPPLRPVTGKTRIAINVELGLYFIRSGSSDLSDFEEAIENDPLAIVLPEEGASVDTPPEDGCMVIASERAATIGVGG